MLLSSHIISDLERACDYLIILSRSRVALAGDMDEIRRTHKRLVGPRADPAAIASLHNVIEVSHSKRQTTLLARLNGQVFDSAWQQQDVSLEDITLAYLGQARDQPSADAAGLAGAPELEFSHLGADAAQDSEEAPR